MRRLMAALTLATLITSFGLAQSWPDRPIHTVVPLSAGSASDLVARAVMSQVSTSLGQTIVIENRPGAGNTIAMAAVARAEPDGYTILANSATHSLVPVTYTNLTFDTFRDLTPVIPLGNTPMMMTVLPSKGYKNVADFVARAKEQNSRISYSGGGVGSIPHLATEAFRLAAGFDGVHVPFRGAPEALTEVLAGRIDFYFSPLPAVLALLKSGQLQALATTGSTRAGAFPDIPTLGEAGYAEATYNFWVGLFVPSKTPAAITDRLYGETEKALQTQVVKERLAALGVDPLPLDRTGFSKLVQNEFALNTRVIKATGLKFN
jgi:tripartite-type tricarboxylate transporter receptor subunit TctC